MSDSLPLTFTAIDFEIANDNRNSVCSVGLTVVRNGEVSGRHGWLVRPPELRFMEFLMELHKITPSQVRDKPEFNRIWPELSDLIEGPLVAHNASFDMSVLRHALDTYDIPCPELDYFCSLNLAREQWPGLPNYTLGSLAEHLDIPLAHHQAEDDAYASALLVVLAARQSAFVSLAELLDARGVMMGRLRLDSPGPSHRRSGPRAGHFLAAPSCTPGDLVPRTNDFKEGHPFYRRVVVFTGTLQTMTRVQAWQAVVDVGGTCATSVTKKADVLVVGDQDVELLNGHDKSSKMRTAEELCAKGCPIEIISENEFLRLLGGGA